MMDLGKALLETTRWFDKAEESAKQFHALAQLEQRPRPDAVRDAITHYASLTSDAITQATEVATCALSIVVLKVADEIREARIGDQIDRAQTAEIDRRIVTLRACEMFAAEFLPHYVRWTRGLYQEDELQKAIRLTDPDEAGA